MRPGIDLLSETAGTGAEIQRHRFYRFKLRCWLSHGDPVSWSRTWAPTPRACLEDDGTTLIVDLRVDREAMFAGLFYGVEGMRVGGTRKLRIAPHLAYGAEGVPGAIPSNALLTVEVTVISELGVA